MSKTWFTSDLHIWHANVIRYSSRPYASVEEMNEALVRNWNAVVAPEDTVYVLGDFSLAARAVETHVRRLNGTKHLILGNHDFPHPAHQKGRKPELREKWTKQYLEWGFASIAVLGKFEIPGVATFNLHHIPYSTGYGVADEEGRQYPVQKHAGHDDGLPLLCGHVHEKWTTKITTTGSLMINVGVDSPNAPWSGQYRPASLEEITEVYLKAAQT